LQRASVKHVPTAAIRPFSAGIFAGLLYLSHPDLLASPLEDVIGRIKPSIVAVGTYQRAGTAQFTFRGTGFVVGDGSLVATNAHVVPESLDAQKVESLAIAVPADGDREVQRRSARVVAVDKEHDVALLRIAGSAMPALKLAATDDVREGQDAAFTGFPIGSVLGLVPVTHRAMVSAVTPIALPAPNASQLDERVLRRLQSGAFKVLQLDATAYPGNSGSPLYDTSTGQVIGVINMVFVKTTKEAILSQPSGISFAVPAGYLRALLATVR
jgi:S1-C subfamily serine protease